MLAISPLIPIRFGSMEETRHLNSGACSYFQKWQYGDIISLQILKDSILPIQVKVQDLNTGKIDLTASSIVLPSDIMISNFYVHSIEIRLDSLSHFGRFFITLDDLIHSMPFEYKKEHEDTILLEYHNTYNAFNVIFEVGYRPTLRVEGSLSLYQPRLDSTVYNDQTKNTQLLSAVAFRDYTLFVGNGRGIVDWMLDLVNMTMGCNNKRVNDFNFEITDGSEFEVQRTEGYPLVAASIEVTEKNNLTASIWIGDLTGYAYIIDEMGRFISDEFKNKFITKL